MKPTHTLKYIDIQQSMINNLILAPTGHMGISRSQMPQIDFKYRDEFINFIKSRGLVVKNCRVPTRSLKLVQGEYDRDKVGSIISKGSIGDAPIFISIDGFVVDGNHRLIAQLNMPSAKSNYIKVTELGMPAKELLKLIEEFPHVRYRTLNENKLK